MPFRQIYFFSLLLTQCDHMLDKKYPNAAKSYPNDGKIIFYLIVVI